MAEKKKIAFLINSLRQAGPVVVLRGIVANLDPDKYEIHIIRFRPDEAGRSITSQFEALGANIHTLLHTHLDLELRTRTVAREVDSLLADIRPDILHTHGYHPVLIASSLRHPVPRIETLHNVCNEDYRLSHGALIGKYMTRRYLRALRHLDAGAAISDTVRRYYRAHSRLPRVELVYNGVDTLRPGKTRSGLRRDLGLPEDKSIFIVVGSLWPRKDPLTVIRAFRRMKESGRADNAMLLFLGKGPLAEECRQEAEGYPDIRFAGWQPNPLDYLAAADYSVCASRSEGFGLNFIESLAVGTPVVSSRIPTFGEFTRRYTSLAPFTFPPGDDKALAEAMERIMVAEIPSEEIAADACEYFSNLRMAREYSELYQSLSQENQA